MYLQRAPRLVGGVAEVLQRTIGALGFAGDAQRATVQDDLVRETNPLVARDRLHQVLLDLLRILVFRQLQAARDALHMRVHHHAVGDPVPRSQHDVRGLAGHSGQLQEFVHGARYLAAELADQLTGGAHHRLRFVAEESGGANVVFELFGLERGKRFGRRVFLEDDRRDHVDAYVGALRRKDGRHQQLPGAVVMQSAGRGRIALVEPLQDLVDALRRQRIVALNCGGLSLSGGLLLCRYLRHDWRSNLSYFFQDRRDFFDLELGSQWFARNSVLVAGARRSARHGPTWHDWSPCVTRGL